MWVSVKHKRRKATKRAFWPSCLLFPILLRFSAFPSSNSFFLPNNPNRCSPRNSELLFAVVPHPLLCEITNPLNGFISLSESQLPFARWQWL